MTDTPEVVTLYGPSAAAERLSVSASGLRRLAPIYEGVFEDLPRTGKGQEDKQARLWPSEAIERLVTARALVKAERYRTIRDALEVIKYGLTVEAEELVAETPQNSSQLTTEAALQVLLKEVQQLRLELREFQAAKSSEASQNNPVSSEETEPESVIVRVAKQLDSFIKRFFRSL